MNWLVVTLVVLAALFLLSRLVKKTLRKVLVAALVVIALSVASGTAICWEPPANEQLEPDYAVLLGYALEDGKPAGELVRRLELALDWLEENPGKTLIVTGGDAQGQRITEAQVMHDWLAARGADMSRVLVEDQAADTRQNLEFCRELAEQHGLGTDTVEILTSEYHQTRARFLAGQLGQAATGLSCETPFMERLEASVREVYSFVKAWLETM